jgi:hypothetical protein
MMKNAKLGAMRTNEPKPEERLRRMREMFAKEGGILGEDYEHFTTPQDEPIPRNKAQNTSVKPCGKQVPKRS